MQERCADAMNYKCKDYDVFNMVYFFQESHFGYKDDITNDVGRKLNGINTQGENVVGNGGFKLAYLAYHRMANQLTEPETR
ncbi:hypothetical protein J6590_023941 [Homalodisca vitripennis]|nr:hypothetical protein J6590_023941 [Homalodisca vitripennis]